ncbi:MAG: N-acetyltransferase [Alphaproteobacteria bacterium]|nr:N-acetyltransferase [Alphaproteobacteria bacterium]
MTDTAQQEAREPLAEVKPSVGNKSPSRDTLLEEGVFQIVAERPEDAAAIEALLDVAFGPDRHRKTSYRFRDGLTPAEGLSLIALDAGTFQGSLRFWPVQIDGAKKPLLLGPLAVDPARRGQAIGVALVRRGLRLARRLGHDWVILIGDYAYYKRFGFVHAFPHGLRFPEPVDARRFLVRRIPRGPITGISGLVRRADGAAVSAEVVRPPS